MLESFVEVIQQTQKMCYCTCEKHQNNGEITHEVWLTIYMF